MSDEKKRVNVNVKGETTSVSIDEIDSIVVEEICEVTGKDKNDISVNTSMIDGAAFDSLDVVEVIMALEEKFDIEIPDEEAQKMSNISDIISFVKTKAKVL